MSTAQQPTSDRVREVIRLSADRDTVWRTIGDFDRMAVWHPLIATSEPTTIEGDTYRHLIGVDGDRYFDRLIEMGDHHIAYEMVESPFPAINIRATLSCVDEADGCHVFWSAVFVPAYGADDVADRIIAKFMEIGLTALGDRFG